MNSHLKEKPFVTAVKQPKKFESMESMETFDKPATRRLLRKIDLRLIPFLALLYL